jgi:outer membrane immunogenic protein
MTKNLKKTLIATAVLGFLGASSALAADIAVKAPMKAPPPAYNWTGCYLGGGVGYGVWNQDGFLESDPGHVPSTLSVRSGGRGWFGTAAVGCDYEFPTPAFFGSNIVIGVFADGDWGSLRGSGFTWSTTSSETMNSAYAVGGRLGWVVTPQLLSYWNGGWTQARFGSFEVISAALGDLGLSVPSHTYNGWFIGGGVEYGFPLLPGLFWRNEVRYASYRADDISIISNATGLSSGTAFNSQKTVQTAWTALIWRFSWPH